jgi:hypothetical protein
MYTKITHFFKPPAKRPRSPSESEDEADTKSTTDAEEKEEEEEEGAPTGPVRRAEASVVDGVKLRFGTKPIEWTDKKTGRPMTNVAHVSWDKSNDEWHVEKVNDAGKKVRVASCATLAKAVEKRRDVKDGVKGPGKLVVRADGTVPVGALHARAMPQQLAKTVAIRGVRIGARERGCAQTRRRVGEDTRQWRE